MGVYIKGMKMPKDCCECMKTTNRLGNWCRFFRTIGRADGCPLVEVAEPHGRLIDADVLTGMISKKTAEPEYQHTGEDWRIGLYLADGLTYEVPTVLETESKK